MNFFLDVLKNLEQEVVCGAQGGICIVNTIPQLVAACCFLYNAKHSLAPFVVTAAPYFLFIHRKYTVPQKILNSDFFRKSRCPFLEKDGFQTVCRPSVLNVCS
jgi:hypothetical protein